MPYFCYLKLLNLKQVETTHDGNSVDEKYIILKLYDT